jgi:hypothetical protein
MVSGRGSSPDLSNFTEQDPSIGVLGIEKYGLFHLAGPSELRSGFDSALSCHQQADVVAIHGINGHPQRTWTHSNGKCWLKDFLPECLVGARIFSYGYASEVAFSLSWAEIHDFARSLLGDLNNARMSPSVSLFA